jgi:polysaccharide export outer membrane protein
MRINKFIAMLLAALAACIAGCASRGAPGPDVAANESAGAEYRIGPGDQLNIYVWNHPELSRDVPVRPDGRISTPLVEDIEVSGKTPTQLARDIEVKIGEYVRNPKVNVIVTNAHGTLSDQIRVVGQAAKPQALPFRNGMTLLDVMTTVGGLGEFAAGNRARIIRRVDGKQVQIRVRLKDLVQNGDISANVPMVPGDVLLIPESRF